MKDITTMDRLVVLTDHPKEGREMFVIPYHELQRFKKARFRKRADLDKYLQEHGYQNLDGAVLILAGFGKSSGT